MKCNICAHNCDLKIDKLGICKARTTDGQKIIPLNYGKIIALNLDPIEKKPLYHFMPKTITLSYACMGCNLKCPWCQNYTISQIENTINGEYKDPEYIIDSAIRSNAPSISHTYSEPTIYFEYAYDVMKLSKPKNLKNIFVSNGYQSDETREKLIPYLDAINIDLKASDPVKHKKFTGGNLDVVIKNIFEFHKAGVHVEITSLIIPGVNNTENELNDLADIVASIDCNIPWHISRFFPHYKMKSTPQTSRETLNIAYEIAKKKKIKHIHLGNI